MPLVSRPVGIDGGFYLDGGLSDAMQRAYDIGRRKAEAIVNDHHLH